MSATAVLFPGQGVQTPAMEHEVRRRCPELARALEEAVGPDPFGRLGEGTAIVQPALYCAGVAAWRALEAEGTAADAFAGHSLGEFAALVAAGSLEPAAGLELVVARGRITAETGRRHGDGGMLAVMGAEVGAIAELAAAAGVHVANANSPRQAVLSGDRARLSVLAADAEERRLRCVPLDVEGAFHCPAMAEAAERFADHLAEVDFAPARRPVYCGLTAEPFEDPRRQLAESLTQTVRWCVLVRNLDRDGITTFVDAGPGTVLAGLVKRTLRGADVVTADRVPAEAAAL
jgi:[acyl-carrier-protein] S-malonyltransferase